MDIVKSQLSISHLKMMVALEQTDTVKEAAQALFITQPALTNRIREAERRLNTPLFIRRGRKLIMSNAGKRLLHSAKKILDELARAEYDIERFSDGVEQVLRLGVPHYAAFSWLPKAIKSMRDVFPQLELEITAQASVQPLAALQKGEVDIAMLSSTSQQLSLDKKYYDSALIQADEFVACLSAKHSKANQQSLAVEDFVDETYVTNSTVPEKDREYELFFKPANKIPRKVLQVGFNEAIVELIKENLGVSIFLKQQIAPYLTQHDIKMIPLGKQGLKVYWHLVYTKQTEVIKPAKHLITLLKQQAN